MVFATSTRYNNRVSKKYLTPLWRFWNESRRRMTGSPVSKHAIKRFFKGKPPEVSMRKALQENCYKTHPFEEGSLENKRFSAQTKSGRAIF